jgi:hypothetical protein
MIESALREILTGYQPLNAKVSTKIYPVEFPQGYQKPAIIYEKVTDTDEGSHRQLTIQYAVHASKYSEAEAVIELIEEAFTAFDSGRKGGYHIYGIEQTGNLMQSADPEVSLYERSELFTVLYSKV